MWICRNYLFESSLLGNKRLRNFIYFMIYDNFKFKNVFFRFFLKILIGSEGIWKKSEIYFEKCRLLFKGKGLLKKFKIKIELYIFSWR